MDAGKKNKTDMRQMVKTLGQVLTFMLKNYKFSFLVVVLCIVGAAMATLRGTLFMQSLIDDYIVPLTQAKEPDFTELKEALFALAVSYGIGTLCA